VLRPATFRAGMRALPRFFVPERARGVEAVIAFELTGAEPGHWHLVIAGGALRSIEGPPPHGADLTIRTASEVWLAVMRGELGGAEAFLTGQAVATGDSALLLALGSFFELRVAAREPPAS
jgi:putative sterol carrier protein